MVPASGHVHRVHGTQVRNSSRGRVRSDAADRPTPGRGRPRIGRSTAEPPVASDSGCRGRVGGVGWRPWFMVAATQTPD